MKTSLALLAALTGAAGLLGCVAVAERVARAALRAGRGYYRYRPYTRRRLDIDVTALPQLSPVARVEINCDGERGGPPPKKGERAFRGLVAGGSAAECFYLDQDQTWGAVAERILSRPEHLAALGVQRVHIGNVARAILPCAGQHLLLSQILPRYNHLDAILIMVGASDVVGWLEQGMPSKLPVGPAAPSSVFEQHPEGPWGWKPQTTALWQMMATAHRRFARPLGVTPNAGDWLHRVRRMRAQARQVIHETNDPSPMLDSFEHWLRELVALCQKKASRVIVVRQPWMGEHPTPEEEKLFWNFALGRPYKEHVEVYCAMQTVARLMRLADTRAAAVAQELGVDSIDLMAQLEPGARNYYDCLHFTPVGAESVGRIVADQILFGTRLRARAPERRVENGSRVAV